MGYGPEETEGQRAAAKTFVARFAVEAKADSYGLCGYLAKGPLAPGSLREYPFGLQPCTLISSFSSRPVERDRALESRRRAGADDDALFVARIAETMWYAAVKQIGIAGLEGLYLLTNRYLDFTGDNDSNLF